MNATVITTGPGVIIETATASMNCRSVSQWNWWTTPPYRNGTIASPLPNTKRLAPAKYVRIFQSTPTDAGPPRPLARSEEHTSELQSQSNLVCRLLLEKKKTDTRHSRVCGADMREP